MFRVSMLLIILIFISGCSAHKIWYGADKPQMSVALIDNKGNVTLKNRPLGDGSVVEGYVITWSPEYNAAFVSASGKGCVQPAVYARTSSGEISLPSEILGALSSTRNATAEFSEAISKLAAVTERSSLLSIGMFGICQLSASGSINERETATLVRELLRTVDVLQSSGNAGVSEKE